MCISKSNLKLSAAAVCFFLIMACMPMRMETIDDGSIPPWTIKGGRPKIVAVLPFTNETPLSGLENVVRESFISHLSPLNYKDREIGKVDSTLKMIQKSSSKTWRELSPQKLGEMLRAELLIYGRVKKLKKYYFGVYAQIVLEVEAKIVSCDTGRRMWRTTTTTRTHDGGLPFDLFSISSAAVRSGMFLQNEKITGLVDQLNRRLVAEIPNPPALPLTNTVIELQVASFRDEARAQKALKTIQQQGLKPHIMAVALGSDLWHRVMLGPFYNADEADEVKKAVRKNTQFKPIVIRRDHKKKSN